MWWFSPARCERHVRQQHRVVRDEGRLVHPRAAAHRGAVARGGDARARSGNPAPLSPGIGGDLLRGQGRRRHGSRRRAQTHRSGRRGADPAGAWHSLHNNGTSEFRILCAACRRTRTTTRTSSNCSASWRSTGRRCAPHRRSGVSGLRRARRSSAARSALVTVSYQVYALTKSNLDVGLLSLAQLVPLLTLTVLGGPSPTISTGAG